MQEGLAVGVLCVALGGVAAQWVAWRMRLPAIVLLFFAGLVFGPGLHILDPGRAFGFALQPMVGLAVAVIVFEGGLALEFRELRAAGEGVLRLTAIALPINWALGAVAAHLLGGLGWGPAALFGAITVVTGPTVVLPLLRHTRLQRRAAAFLKWEAIVNDPIGAILATLVLQVLVAGQHGAGVLAGTLLLRIPVVLGIATALGVGAGFLVRFGFTRDQVPEILKTPLLLALTLSIYAVANLTLEGAGLMAATIFGVALANLRVPGLSELRRFKESLVVLLVSALFIVLTANLQQAQLAHLSWPILALTLAVLFVVRPVAILIATLRSGLTRSERLLSAWIAPRGIVAAAVAGIAGLQLQKAGYAGADLVMPAVFAIIAATMILHGFSLRPLARRLGLTLSDEPGIGLVGASPWATEMAAALTAAGVPTLLIDIYPGALDPARARGLSVLQAEILSEQGAEELQGRPVDYLIAVTPDDIYNGLVCARLAPELGRERVFQISPGETQVDLRRGLSRESRGKVLGRYDWDYAVFERLFERGWTFNVIEMTEDQGALPEYLFCLLILHRRGGITLPSPDDPVRTEPLPGDRILAFVSAGSSAATPTAMAAQ